MGHRLSKISTKTGDHGETGLGNGERIAKSSILMTTIGDVDELNSHLGLAHCELAEHPNLRAIIDPIQQHLFDLGGELSIPGYQLIKEEHLLYLEQQLQHANDQFPPLKEFILPRGSRSVCQLHVCRTVCRRAERNLWQLSEQANSSINPLSARYLNRLSDLLFVLARLLGKDQQLDEQTWQR